ncbi:unnamed protein product, partial [Allacma fusca]
MNDQEAARVRGFLPAHNRYARRNNIRAWLEDVMQQEGDAEDVALGRQVLDQLRANLANDALDQLRRRQVRADRYNMPLDQQLFSPHGNPLLDPAFQNIPQDLANQPALLV